MDLHELVHVVGSFELVEREVESLEHVLHLQHASILPSHVVLRIQGVSEVEDRFGKLLHCLPILAVDAGQVELRALELVLVVEAVVEGHLVEQLSQVLSSQVLDDRQYHQEECVGLEAADKMVVESEGLADLFEGEEKRFDLRVHAQRF